jgi:hypothetical protein
MFYTIELWKNKYVILIDIFNACNKHQDRPLSDPSSIYNLFCRNIIHVKSGKEPIHQKVFKSAERISLLLASTMGEYREY